MQEAKERAAKYGVTNVVLPCVSGRTVMDAVGEFGSGFNYYAVGNPASSHAKGLVHHSGVTDAVKDKLERTGVRVILQEVSHSRSMSRRAQGCISGMSSAGPMRKGPTPGWMGSSSPG